MTGCFRGRWSRAPDKLTPLLRLRYQNALADASQDLGPPDQIRQTFLGFQQLLYPAHPTHGNAPTL